MKLELQPLDYKEAKAYILAHHRHLEMPAKVGYKFAIGLNDGAKVVGCIVVAKPQARMRRGPYVAEVTRCCTDGTPHAASKLYAAAWRAARAMGFRALGTYTLPIESGASLRAAGWRLVYTTEGGSWNRPSRPRVDTAPTCPKLFWEASA